MLVNRDLNAISIEATLNGTDYAISPSLSPLDPQGWYLFVLPPMTAVDGTLQLRFAGDPGYDVSIDNLRLWIARDGETFGPPDVPAPAALGLFGLGVAALGMRRRAR